MGILLVLALAAGIAFAAFGDKGEILGSTFTVASADIKFLEDPTLGIDPNNLVDQLPGPTFSNIKPEWTEDYLVKISNNGTSTVQISSNAFYETINDPEDLRQIIYVEIIEWNDANANGIYETGEEGNIIGKKTIVKWKTEGFSLGDLNSGDVMSLILRFSTEGLTDSKQGSTAIFDFEFESIEM